MPRTISRIKSTDNRMSAALFGRYAASLAAIAAALAASAALNSLLARRAEIRNPPRGRFVQAAGTRLHYVDRGAGDVVVLLHGNGSMVEDFESSGLIDILARDYRVIAFDRPGFGHSERPSGVWWSPEAQADLIDDALTRIGAPQATVVVGHSWASQVAVALALRHPARVKSLVLASGYYFPTRRTDAFLFSGLSVPVFGDLLRYTFAPILGRLLWPLVLRVIFGPDRTPPNFRQFPKEMAVRPSQLRASAAEAGQMVPNARRLSEGYARLTMPVVVIAGESDRVVDTRRQSRRLHRAIGGSSGFWLAGAGHMIHQTNTGSVAAAINRAATMTRRGVGSA
jgi:pimeloyl-ACP methyl ester carboxylesterase